MTAGRCRRNIEEYVNKCLYTGDLSVLRVVRDAVVSGSWKEAVRVFKTYREPVSRPEVTSPPLGHDVTTCCPSVCCRNLERYLADDAECAVIAALRSCVGGHSEFVWNVMETFSGHDPYVSLLKEVYGHCPGDDLVKCGVLVCCGAVVPFVPDSTAPGPGDDGGDAESRVSPELDYLWIVPKLDPDIRRPFRDPDRSVPAPVKGVTVDSWKECERTVKVVLQR